jgi:predicted dehydrogenase
MKVLMAGLGGIGQRHVRNLRTLLGSEVDIYAYRVRGLSDVLTDKLKLESGSNLEEKYGITSFKDLDNAMSQNPDIVFVCNPSLLHVPIALTAARAGCHLFIEKPLSHNSDGISELIDIAERKHLITFVGYQLRFHPCLVKLRTLLQNRAVGQVVAVRVEVGEYLPGFHTYEDYRQLYASRKDLGGGVILSQIHELDFVYWLFGLPQRIFALGGHLSNLEIDVEDIASILMECVVDGQAVPVHVHQDYLQRPPSRTCQVIGDAGKIVLDLNTPTIQVFDQDGELTEKVSYDNIQRNQLFLDELKHFLACIKGYEQPMVTVRDGWQSLKMALAAKESLKTGKVVDLK